MRKSILTVGLTVIVALFCTTCYDSGTDSDSGRWAGDVDRFLRGLDGATPPVTPPVTPGAAYKLSTTVSPLGSGFIYLSPQKETYSSGETVTVTAEAVNSEYAFAGWEGASNAITGSVTVIMSSNKTLTANFTKKQANTYTLTVNAEPPVGGTVTSSPARTVYTANENVTVMATPYNHYTFIGWSGASSATSEEVPIVMNGNKELTANFTINKYKLTTGVSVDDGGTVNRSPEKDAYNAGDTVTVTATAAQNYTFKGWSGASSSTKDTVKIIMDGPKALTADFGKVGANISRFTIYFDGNGATGNAPDAKTTDSGNTITLPDPMVKTGHQFGGWNTNNTGTGTNYAAGSSYTVTQNNVTLYARWLPVRTVTFNANGGTVLPTSGTTDTTGKLTFSPPTPTRTGYKFGGWFTAETSGTSITTEHTFNADAIIYARWTIVTYNVTWNNDGGSPIPSQTTVDHGGSITAPNAMTKTGYAFGGWYSNEALTSSVTFPITNVTANATLYAKWTLNSYTVTWNADGGTPTPTQITVNHGGSITAPTTTLTKTGYAFDGWYTNTGLTIAATFPITNVTENKTFYAKWTGGTVTPPSGDTDSTFIDSRDSRVYKKVLISGKMWMAENLNVQTTSGSWCYNNSADSCKKYGRLYNWQTAKTVCPSGWYLPSRQEWGNLARAVGGTGIYGDGGTDAGKTLKSTYGWYNSGNGNDTYGFSALPGGSRYYSQSLFSSAGYYGDWWTATAENGSDSAYYRYIYYNNTYGNVGEAKRNKNDGFSVRCVKEE